MSNRNPQVDAIRAFEKIKRECDACLHAGLFPVALGPTVPMLVHRWEMHHECAPYVVNAVDLDYPEYSKNIWVEAWVVALIHNHGLSIKNIFGTGWTTVLENKPKILELKMAYERSLKDLEQRLITLTTYQLILGNSDVPALLHLLPVPPIVYPLHIQLKHVLIALAACTHQVQHALNSQGESNDHALHR